MITFKNKTSVQVIENFDESTDTAETVEQIFEAGELVDAEITSEENGVCELQYGDGSISQGIRRELFNIVPDWDY